MIETHKRSILKAITWRILAAIITTSIAFLFTRETALSIGIGFFDTLIKLFGYYLHERAWNRTSFGKA